MTSKTDAVRKTQFRLQVVTLLQTVYASFEPSS